MLLNLISNSAKFTEGGTITLEAQRFQEPGREWLRCAVSDTGIGIPAEKRGTLFDEFAQAEVPTSSKYGGTGLGLSITKRFCAIPSWRASTSRPSRDWSRATCSSCERSRAP